jgi:hypothetical protein
MIEIEIIKYLKGFLGGGGVPLFINEIYAHESLI